MFLKKFIKTLSLQWRLTLMAAAVAIIACTCLTAIISKSANTKMDEITALFIDDGLVYELGPNDINNIEIIPQYYDKLESSKQNFNTLSIAAMAGIIFISSLLTYFIAGKSLKQLRKFSENIENIQAQNLSEPLNTENLPKEIRRLSLEFNKMLARLEQSFTAQKQFSANAAHELRTPLAIMQAKIDVFRKTENHSNKDYEQALDMLNVQIERLSSIVNELLDMTGLNTAERTDKISLNELAEEVLCDLEYQARQKNIQLVLESGNAEFYGNETLIYRAIFNLVENAIKYNHAGGKVTVSITNTDTKASLIVSDTGFGIPEEYHEMIFESFFRVDKSRSREMGGAGIGLAMVKSIAKLHGGTAYVKNSSSNGSDIVVEFTIPNP